MLKLGVIVVAVIVLNGCASDVDKCVDASMKAWKVENKEAKRFNEENKKYNEEVKKYNEEVKAYNARVPATNSTSYKDGRVLFDLNKAFENHKPYKEYRMKKIDERPLAVVEAEYRQFCMRLSSR